MCLVISKGTLPKRASKDIIVYKLVLKTIGDLFISPCIGTNLFIEKNLPITKIDSKEFIIEQGIYCGTLVDKVYQGGFHCYSHLSDAVSEKRYLNKHYPSSKYYVVECIIPMGTVYYEGDYAGYGSFCTKKLIINKIIS